MKVLFFGLIFGIHCVGVCDFSVKCQFVTHETVYTQTGEIFHKANNPYILPISAAVLTIRGRNLKFENAIVPDSFYLAETCISQPPLLGYDCFAIKNYSQGDIPAIYVSRNDQNTALIKAPVGKGLLGQTRLTHVDYYNCPN